MAEGNLKLCRNESEIAKYILSNCITLDGKRQVPFRQSQIDPKTYTTHTPSRGLVQTRDYEIT